MSPNKFRKIIDFATTIANQSECTQKMSCILTDRKGKILGYSQNLRKSHPYQKKIADKVGLEKKIHLHAELGAICKLRENRERVHSAFVVRITKHGLGMAKPCKICALGLSELGVNEIIYSINYNLFMREICDACSYS